jgi:hypothetical protein
MLLLFSLDALLLKYRVEIEHASLPVEGDDCSLTTDISGPDTGTFVNLGGYFSLLQKRSRLFKLSPRKKKVSHQNNQQRRITFWCKTGGSNTHRWRL